MSTSIIDLIEERHQTLVMILTMETICTQSRGIYSFKKILKRWYSNKGLLYWQVSCYLFFQSSHIIEIEELSNQKSMHGIKRLMANTKEKESNAR